MTEWISVKERLPEHRDIEHSYLIFDGENIGIGWLEDDYYAIDENDPCIFEGGGWSEDSGYLHTDPRTGFPLVTHWMSLPLPPETNGS